MLRNMIKFFSHKLGFLKGYNVKKNLHIKFILQLSKIIVQRILDSTFISKEIEKKNNKESFAQNLRHSCFIQLDKLLRLASSFMTIVMAFCVIRCKIKWWLNRSVERYLFVAFVFYFVFFFPNSFLSTKTVSKLECENCAVYIMS